MSARALPAVASTRAPRILLATARYPHPVGDGSDRRVGQLGEALRGFEVHLVVDEDRDRPGERRIAADGFAALHVVPPPPRAPGLARRALRRLTRPKFDDRCYWDARVLERVRAIDAERPIDAVIIETVRYAWLLDALPGRRPHVIDAVDIWHERYRVYAALGKGAILEQYRDPEREMARYRAADLTLSISSHDTRAMLAGGVPAERLLEVPVAFAPQRVPSLATGPELLLAGVTGEANEEAAVWFVDEVLPRVRERVPAARIALLRVPAPLEARFAGRPEVRCLPYLGDIDLAYRAARVVVVPLRRGTGIKVKVLEALSRGAATIISPAAAQGIDLAGYAQERFPADAEGFADQVVRALGSVEYRTALAETGLAVIERGYRPERVYGPFVAALEERIERVRDGSPAHAGPPGLAAATSRFV